MNLSIEPLSAADWPEVRSIYDEGIATGLATFETEPGDWSRWDRGHMERCRLIGRLNDETAGWAALSSVSDRCVYAGVAEVSIYVAAAARGAGVGRALLEQLVRASEREGIWTLQAGVFPENEASVRLHRSCGFRDVGIRERLGQISGTWKDVLLLERRSSVIGC